MRLSAVSLDLLICAKVLNSRQQIAGLNLGGVLELQLLRFARLHEFGLRVARRLLRFFFVSSVVLHNFSSLLDVHNLRLIHSGPIAIINNY